MEVASIALFWFLFFCIAESNHISSPFYDTEGLVLPSNWQYCDTHLTAVQTNLSTIANSVCHRNASRVEHDLFFNEMKSGEYSVRDVSQLMKLRCDTPDSFSLNQTALGEWEGRFDDRIYAWSVDFHASPSSCNIPIYKEIGVILHPEIDHVPHCRFSGLCRKRLEVLKLGAFMAGFSLDPDPFDIKKKFTEHYSSDSEFKRVDVVFCSHPAANCELFGELNKPMIIFLTTRLEFGRHDELIPWRLRAIRHFYNEDQLDGRFQNWTKFLYEKHQANMLTLVANNEYDRRYTQYFTGLDSVVIPSWCGNIDYSYHMQNWEGREVDEAKSYDPLFSVIPIVPYKQSLWIKKRLDINVDHPIFREFNSSLIEFQFSHPHVALDIRHSLTVLSSHHPLNYRFFRALIFIPYQTSVMFFFEIYRQNIPIFAPSLQLLLRWHKIADIMKDRIYGHPSRDKTALKMFLGKKHVHSLELPNPNDNHNEESNKYWFQFCDIYQFPHVVLFDSWQHLFSLLATSNMLEISQNMKRFNEQQRKSIKESWDAVFRKILPHRRQNVG